MTKKQVLYIAHTHGDAWNKFVQLADIAPPDCVVSRNELSIQFHDTTIRFIGATIPYGFRGMQLDHVIVDRLTWLDQEFINQCVYPTLWFSKGKITVD